MVTDIIEAINSATNDDLKIVRNKIAEMTAQLCAMKMAEKLIATRLGSTNDSIAARTSKPRGTPKESMDDRRIRVAKLVYESGPMTKRQITDTTHINQAGPGCLSQVVSCDLFHVSPDGVVSLTDEGERAARTK